MELKLEINEPWMIVMSCDMLGKIMLCDFFLGGGENEVVLVQGSSLNVSNTYLLWICCKHPI